MAETNLPLAFGSLLVGGLLLTHGIAAAKTALASSSSTAAPASTATAAAPASGAHGLVTSSALAPIATAHGWGAADLAAWWQVIMSESNGTLTDTNPGSGAYGIAQFINGPSEYAQYGGDATTLTGQLTAMANYIAQRYGTPSKAWEFHKLHGWY